MAGKRLKVVADDPWLLPVEGELEARHSACMRKLDRIEPIADYANGYNYFGFQYDGIRKGWWFREWLPNAKDVFLFGDFTDWNRTSLRLTRLPNGVWEIFLPEEEYRGRIVDGTRYKLYIHGNNGWHERISAYARYVTEDPQTHNFTPVIRFNSTFDWGDDGKRRIDFSEPLIYECHVGMAQEEAGVGSYKAFEEHILPRIKALGYNTVQLMGIAEHPYYGSFGYHVSNLYAPSSRFGTPDELRSLIKKAHEMGLMVVMDIVHSHYVKNFNEGINELDGSNCHYSRPGEAGNQPYWDSKTYDYGKDEVTHYLLSNLKYWLEEFHFDGFRFDGITSMLYRDHGYREFESRDDYFGDNVNPDALCYLTLANRLIHSLDPRYVSIAEDVSGMPTLCAPVEEGGIGFDYRLAMAVPDYWIELLERPDEQWDLWEMWNELNNRTAATPTIGYVESHDQAMVGDKTIAFRLMDKEMYSNMNKAYPSLVIDRGIALHKMIRLLTISAAGEGYMNFMGNEFGHPDWIDFPRLGNGWNYDKARRQWSLADNGFLRYGQLNAFDKAMIALVKRYHILKMGHGYVLNMDEENKTMVFHHRDLLFVFNWHPTRSITDYIVPVPGEGSWKMVLDSDAKVFGGFGRNDDKQEYFSHRTAETGEKCGHPFYIKIYNLNRTAMVFRLRQTAGNRQ